MKKKVTVLVSNDVTFDKRVEKTCAIWWNEGWDIEVIGVLRSDSIEVNRPYPVRRIKTIFQRGFLFYAVLNLRLFFILAFKSTNVIWSNDLDTLMPAFIWSRIRKKSLIYDSHEWFTEAEGLTGRHGVRRFWLGIESWILPKLKFAITVNDSIAAAYKELYGVDMRVMRNVPLRKLNTPQRDRSKWPFPAEHKWIILQGAYIDPDRGAEEAVDAMKYLENVHLIIAGSGRALEMLKQSADKKKVSFVSKLPYEELLQLTACCDLGLSLDKPIHKNYLYSLPNKIFDYASVQVPVLVSPLPEIQKLLQQYPMGDFIQTWDPHALAKDFQNAITSKRYEEWKENGMRLNQEVCWENESLFLKDWIRNF